MAKIKKFQIVRVPVEIEYIKPVLGRLYAAWAWVRCVKFAKTKIHFHIFNKSYAKKEIGAAQVYLLAIPKFKKVVNNAST